MHDNVQYRNKYTTTKYNNTNTAQKSNSQSLVKDYIFSQISILKIISNTIQEFIFQKFNSFSIVSKEISHKTSNQY